MAGSKRRIASANDHEPGLHHTDGQAAAAERNRRVAVRNGIIGAFQRLGTPYDAWPEVIRAYYSNPQERTTSRQIISPHPFQPPAFDRLNQSPEDWVKGADAA